MVTHLRIFTKTEWTKPFGPGQFSEAPTGSALQNCPRSGIKGRQGACMRRSKTKVRMLHHQIKHLSSHGRCPRPGTSCRNPGVMHFYKVHCGWDSNQETKSCLVKKHHAGESRTLRCPWKPSTTLGFWSRLPWPLWSQRVPWAPESFPRNAVSTPETRPRSLLNALSWIQGEGPGTLSGVTLRVTQNLWKLGEPQQMLNFF